MKAIVINKFGGPEVMEYTEHADPIPNADQILVDIKMIGVNFLDTYQIENSYFYLNRSTLPMVPGIEAYFVINNKNFVGLTDSGSYAEKALVNKNKIFEVPEGVTEEEAIAAVCQGTTAYSLVNYECKIKKGDLVLINGASGGFGMFLLQLCKIAGADVIGVTSNEKKIDFIKSLNVDFACMNNFDEIEKVINNIGRKPNFIFEGYGGKYFESYYDILSDDGQIWSYGASAREGLPKNIKRPESLKRTSVFLGMFIFNERNKSSKTIQSVFDLIKTKKLKIVIGEKMELKNANLMHQKMRNRDTLGKLILTV
jgi:NADPH2:quinone reductase